MEKQVVALPEDLHEMAEEVLQMAFNLRLALFIHQRVNRVARAVAVGPLFHFKSLLKLRVP